VRLLLRRQRAIDITVEVAKEKRDVSIPSADHPQPQVIEKLKQEGISPVDISDLEGKKISSLIIRTHGIPCQLYAAISERGIRIIDATCPFVKNAQHYAKLLKENAIRCNPGDKNHPEVKGIMSYAGDDALVVDQDSPLPRLKTRVGVVVQTTQPWKPSRMSSRGSLNIPRK